MVVEGVLDLPAALAPPAGGAPTVPQKEADPRSLARVAAVLSSPPKEEQALFPRCTYHHCSSPTELRFVTAYQQSHPSSPATTVSMSLFGTSPEDSPLASSTQRSKASLFADEPPYGSNTGNASSSLFADDDSSGSPWMSNNANKRTSKEEIVKTLLPDSDVPETYIDAYDLVLSAGDRVGTGVGLTSIREILSGSGLSATDQAKILNLVISGDSDSSNGLGRGEFSVLLALVGLAQEGEDLTFDAVDDRRKKLPVPKSSYLDALRAKQESATPVQSQDRPATPPPSSAPLREPSSTQSRRSARGSMGSFEADPWGSPQLHRGHNHAQTESEHAVLNGFGSVRSGFNAWSSRASDGDHTHGASDNGRANGHTDTAPNNAGFGWGENAGNTSEGSGGGLGGPVRAGLGGFGSSGSDQGEPNPRRRSLGIGRVSSPRLEEVITITLLPEKEGMFMFQHRNYEVKSARRQSTVVRRYSDFVWLLDCLHKRYPFRQLPLLPPKRLAVNGTHLAADSNSFLEKRRRGLVRFTNALVRHPVLSQEQLVIMFLTVPTELSVWRKQATISVQDEFTGRALPPDLEDSLPSDLTDMFDTVRSGVKRSAEVYINLCTLLERLAKRNEGLAADHLRFSLALQSLTEMTRDTYAFDTNDVPLLNEGIKATARHLSASQSLLEDEARAWEEGMLEDLKRQRDCLVSVREMFDRRDRYARNNIPQLEKRIENSERKLQDLRARTQPVKPGEIEKVEESIVKDKESIVHQHARGVFIKECIRNELMYFQQSQYHISRLHQDWSQERVKYSELQADNWRSLSDQVEGMPLGD
ncbi:sorting nexin mvp1 [Aspergillus awamori]|uniref:Sorting nexin MVP1 n=1 Tax=Aspergillus awamori TaxID=105351 RepID=A0A401KVT7_ASPAW|nr:sorting nexin mvp1 [Aspergillus awamori]